MIQHHGLKERAILLQEELMCKDYDASEVEAKQLNLFVRYQTTHERSYYKALKELQKQKRQAEIGFKRKNRQQEAHEAQIRLTHARAQNLEIDAVCRQVMEVPIPGNERISFEELAKACAAAIATIAHKKQMNMAA